MTTLRKNTHSLFVSAALVASTFGFTADASAGWIAEGYADLGVTLTSVLDTEGEDQGPGQGTGWSVSSTGSVSDSDAGFTGSGLATEYTELFPNDSWAVEEPYFQYSESIAEAGGVTGNEAGTASSFADTLFSVTLENNSGSGSGSGGKTFVFEFDVFSLVTAILTQFPDSSSDVDAAAFAAIGINDADGESRFFSSAEAFAGGPLFDETFSEESLRFTVLANDSYTFSGVVYSDASAVVSAAVPVAPTFWLLGAGLLGLLYAQRRNPVNMYARNLV